ncbi:MAG: hypothetical protein IIW40_05425 [Clostridia bacterium]|nr:hypothetical protein [Clostridia bacterium]
MAREMLLAGVDPEELKPTPKAEPPKTPKGKWENFWYHYKWHTLGGLFALVAAIILIAQAASVDRADYMVLLVTDAAYDDFHLTTLENKLASYGEDVDGDGKVEVEILNTYLGKNGSNMTNAQVMQTHLWAGDVALFIWEPHHYEQLMTNLVGSTESGAQFLQTPSVKSDGLREDGTWDWATNACRTEGVLKDFPEHLYFGVRHATGTAKNSAEMCEQNMKLLENLITDTRTAVPTK